MLHRIHRPSRRVRFAQLRSREQSVFIDSFDTVLNNLAMFQKNLVQLDRNAKKIMMDSGRSEVQRNLVEAYKTCEKAYNYITRAQSSAKEYIDIQNS